jgi:hypothetical protein
MTVCILLATSGNFIADMGDEDFTEEQAINATWDLLLNVTVIYGHWRGDSSRVHGERFNAQHVVSVGIEP